MSITFTPTELAFLAAAVKDRIDAMDAVAARLAAERERLGSGDLEAETIGLAVRQIYTTIARRLEQQLDVPFVDQDEAVRMLFAEGSVVVGVRS